MAKYLRFIGFFILALAFWQTASDAFTASNSVSVNESVDNQAVTLHLQQDNSCFTTPQLPLFPDAELAGTSGAMQLLASSRIQRLCTNEYLFSIREWVDKLAQYEAVLSLHREKLYDATAYYCCQPVCEYYIFMLRRILI